MNSFPRKLLIFIFYVKRVKKYKKSAIMRLDINKGE